MIIALTFIICQLHPLIVNVENTALEPDVCIHGSFIQTLLQKSLYIGGYIINTRSLHDFKKLYKGEDLFIFLFLKTDYSKKCHNCVNGHHSPVLKISLTLLIKMK